MGRKEIQHCPFQWYACANHRSAITTMHKHAHTLSHTLPRRAAPHAAQLFFSSLSLLSNLPDPPWGFPPSREFRKAGGFVKQKNLCFYYEQTQWTRSSFVTLQTSRARVLREFKNSRRSHSGTNAHADDSVSASTALKLVDDTDGEARSRHSQRVTNCDGRPMTSTRI